MKTTPNSGQEKPLIYDFDLQAIKALLTSWGEPSYRADQIWKGLYQRYWHKPNQFTNLPKRLRPQLGDHFSFKNLSPKMTQNSSDGETQKILFHLPDGKPIETVLMHYDVRHTLCISTQSGCALGCSFCATGQMGFMRNLTSGEICEQILTFARHLELQGERVTNVVFMGMGEPFHNYSNVMDAIYRLNHPKGMNLGMRRFTISTVGLVPQIKQFSKENIQANLAVSLHAADDELRTSMMPINKKYPISYLLSAVSEYTQVTNRRVTFEWALIKDVNDTLEQAAKLVNLIDGMLAHVNLIPLNPTQGFKGDGTDQDRAQKFQSFLENHGIPCTIRVRRGIDIQAGCGQLASR
jgi:23S rRNA (adenine2503-C2)-methyltransferase